MLIKEIYTIPAQNRDMLELRDGSLYTFCVVPSRVLTMADLTPVKSALPRDMTLAYNHAKPYDTGLREFQMKSFGLTDCPLKAARQDAGMTQQQLADKSGVNIRQIQRIENGDGKMSNVTLENAIRLSDALGVDVKELL